jgi:hypothetical protein
MMMPQFVVCRHGELHEYEKKILTNENDEIFASLGHLEVQDNNKRL